MKIKLGTKFKAIEGLSKGKLFTIIEVNSDIVSYRSEETGQIYSTPRKHFEKFFQRVNTYWQQKNKNYKFKKNELKGN